MRRAVGLLGDVVKNQLLAFAPVRALQQARRRRATRGDEENRLDYPAPVYRELRAELEPHRPIEGSLLEIGPGGNLAVAALFAANGVDRVSCIDVVPWETVPADFYAALGVADAVSRVEYRWPVEIEHTPFPDESFDLIVSHACFEHFKDPGQACREIGRLLKPGGATTHEVDLRDHRNFDRPLDFLRYPDWLWDLATSRRPFRTNRWRKSDLVAAFEDAGLEVVKAEPTLTTRVHPAEVAEFQPRFRAKSRDDLAVTGMFMTAVKR